MQLASLGNSEKNSSIIPEQDLNISRHFLTVKSEIDGDLNEDRKTKVKVKLEVFDEEVFDPKSEEYRQRNDYQDIKSTVPPTRGIIDYTKFPGFSQINPAFSSVGAGFPQGFGFSQFYRPFPNDRSLNRIVGGPFSTGGANDAFFDARYDPEFQQRIVNSYSGFRYSSTPQASKRFYPEHRGNIQSSRQGKWGGSALRSLQSTPTQVSLFKINTAPIYTSDEHRTLRLYMYNIYV